MNISEGLSMVDLRKTRRWLLRCLAAFVLDSALLVARWGIAKSPLYWAVSLVISVQERTAVSLRGDGPLVPERVAVDADECWGDGKGWA